VREYRVSWVYACCALVMTCRCTVLAWRSTLTSLLYHEALPISRWSVTPSLAIHPRAHRLVGFLVLQESRCGRQITPYTDQLISSALC